MSAAARVEQLLGAAGRRLSWLGALQRSGWVLLIGVGLVELAVLVDGGPLLAAALLTASCGAGLVALVLSRRAPASGLVAAVVDARLESGGVIAAAAEALTGEHPRFAPLVLEEAQRVLEGWTPAGLVPFRAPPGLLLGSAALILLPALLGGRASAQPAAGAAGPPSLLSPEWVRGGGAEGGAAEPLTTDDELTVAEGGAPTEDDPLAAFAPELAELVRERLGELAREHGVGGAAASAPGSEGPADEAARALAAGEPEQALAALEELAGAAAAGDRAAAAALAGLAERAGAGAGLNETTQPLDPAPIGAPIVLEGGRRARLPRLLETTRRRYFETAQRRSTE
jgi:hypothetical protein